MKDSVNKPKRPLIVTIMSVFALYAGLMFFYQAIGAVINLDISNTIRFIVGGLLFLGVGIGFWLMKKWAVHLYAFFAIFNMIILLLAGKFELLSLVVPGIVVIVGYTQLSKKILDEES